MKLSVENPAKADIDRSGSIDIRETFEFYYLN